jgi:hypothetical protein
MIGATNPPPMSIATAASTPMDAPPSSNAMEPVTPSTSARGVQRVFHISNRDSPLAETITLTRKTSGTNNSNGTGTLLEQMTQMVADRAANATEGAFVIIPSSVAVTPPPVVPLFAPRPLPHNHITSSSSSNGTSNNNNNHSNNHSSNVVVPSPILASQSLRNGPLTPTKSPQPQHAAMLWRVPEMGSPTTSATSTPRRRLRTALSYNLNGDTSMVTTGHLVISTSGVPLQSIITSPNPPMDPGTPNGSNGAMPPNFIASAPSSAPGSPKLVPLTAPLFGSFTSSSTPQAAAAAAASGAPTFIHRTPSMIAAHLRRALQLSTIDTSNGGHPSPPARLRIPGELEPFSGLTTNTNVATPTNDNSIPNEPLTTVSLSTNHQPQPSPAQGSNNSIGEGRGGLAVSTSGSSPFVSEPRVPLIDTNGRSRAYSHDDARSNVSATSTNQRHFFGGGGSVALVSPGRGSSIASNSSAAAAVAAANATGLNYSNATSHQLMNDNNNGSMTNDQLPSTSDATNPALFGMMTHSGAIARRPQSSAGLAPPSTSSIASTLQGGYSSGASTPPPINGRSSSTAGNTTMTLNGGIMMSATSVASFAMQTALASLESRPRAASASSAISSPARPRTTTRAHERNIAISPSHTYSGIRPPSSVAGGSFAAAIAAAAASNGVSVTAAAAAATLTSAIMSTSSQAPNGDGSGVLSHQSSLTNPMMATVHNSIVSPVGGAVGSLDGMISPSSASPMVSPKASAPIAALMMINKDKDSSVVTIAPTTTTTTGGTRRAAMDRAAAEWLHRDKMVVIAIRMVYMGAISSLLVIIVSLVRTSLLLYSNAVNVLMMDIALRLISSLWCWTIVLMMWPQPLKTHMASTRFAV